MNKIDEEGVLLSLKTYREILETMEASDLEKTIFESDNCQNLNK